MEGRSDDGGEARGEALVRQLRALEREGARVRAQLVELGPGARLPGLHLVVGAAGARMLVPCARVAEIARVIAFEPVPGAASWLLGTFVWRGRPALVVDLGARLGGAPATSLEALLLVLDGAPTVGLLVEGATRLVEDPPLAEGAATPATGRLFAGACSVDDEALPVLAPDALERELREAG